MKCTHSSSDSKFVIFDDAVGNIDDPILAILDNNFAFSLFDFIEK
jgi:hypothetical protein